MRDDKGMVGMDESESVVNGMTCAHCAQALRAELGGVPGVIGVADAGYPLMSGTTDRL